MLNSSLFDCKLKAYNFFHVFERLATVPAVFAGHCVESVRWLYGDLVQYNDRVAWPLHICYAANEYLLQY